MVQATLAAYEQSPRSAPHGRQRGPAPASLQTLYRLTEGNPFFVEEMLRSLTARGRISPADLAWDGAGFDGAQPLYTPSIQNAVQRRSERLSAGRARC